MASDSITAVIRGKTSFFKMLPDQLGLNYNKDGKEWCTDLELTKEGVADLKSYGIANKIKKKDNYLNGKPYIRFTRKELNHKGEPNEPVEIVDILGKPWPSNLRLGNETVVDIKFRVKDYGAQVGVYIQKVRVLDHVPYEDSGFEELSEDDEYFAKFAEQEAARMNKAAAEERQFKKDFNLADDLDDEIPVD